MPRTITSPEELQASVQAQVNEIEVVKEDRAKVGVPLPYWHEPDKTGCNWNMNYFRDARGYEDKIAGIVARHRAEFNLPDRK